MLTNKRKDLKDLQRGVIITDMIRKLTFHRRFYWFYFTQLGFGAEGGR